MMRQRIIVGNNKCSNVSPLSLHNNEMSWSIDTLLVDVMTSWCPCPSPSPCPDDRPTEFGPLDCCLMQAENLLIEIDVVLTLAFTRFPLRERCTRPM